MSENINVKLTAEIENIEEIEATISKLKCQLENIKVGFAVEDGDSPRIVQGMKIIRANRGAGKTTELIKQSSAEGKHIICHSRNAVLYIEDLARQMERWIPKPMTVGDLQRSRGLKMEAVLVDEINLVLPQLLGVQVDTITTSSIIEELN